MTYQYQYETEPFAPQRQIFEQTRNDQFFALLWEQGCGKTKPIIDTAAYLYETGQITGVLLVAPGGVERNWVNDELPKHLPKRIDSHTFLWSTGGRKTQWFQSAFTAMLMYEGLVFFCMSYDGFMTEDGKQCAWRFLQRRKTLYILDESDDIRTPSAKRTRAIVTSGKYAPFRRILTGTPADGPFDLYSQLKFLDSGVWNRIGIRNFQVYKHHFAEWDSHVKHVPLANGKTKLQEFETLKQYKNMHEVQEVLAGMSSRMLKTDMHDLPPKLYQKRYFDLTTKQRGYYDRLIDELEIELSDGRVVDGTFALTRLLRLQQITSGYMVTDDGENPLEPCDVKNPRLEHTLALLGKLNHSAIVWCRFRQDVDLLMQRLGESAVRYDGAVAADEAEHNKQAFNNGDAQFFVGNPAKGGRGLTLNVAKTTVYYSNSFRLRDRLQSEDRNHRIGQDTAVLYVDMQAVDTVDQHIIGNLRSKFDIAAELTGDRLREWI